MEENSELRSRQQTNMPKVLNIETRTSIVFSVSDTEETACSQSIGLDHSLTTPQTGGENTQDIGMDKEFLG